MIESATIDGVDVLSMQHGKANALDLEFCDALTVARELAEISPAAFAQTKAQMRAPVAERFAIGGAVTDKTVTDIWCAPETLARVTDYVERVLRR